MNLFDGDHWREIGNALSSNKLRTGLTAFGVFWGIFMLMVMSGSGNGLENGANQGFAGGATNSFFLWAQRTGEPYKGLPSGRAITLTEEDARAIREQVPEAKIVCPQNQLGGYRGGNNVTRGTKAGAFDVMGDYPEIALIQTIKIVKGRFLNPLDVEERRKVAVIGKRVREVLFEPDEEPVGGQIRINGVHFKVIGVFDPNQSGERGDREVQTVYVPFSTYQQAFNNGNRVGWLAVTSQDHVPASVVETKVLALLGQRHRVAPGDTRAFGHFNLEEEYGKVQGLFGGIRALIWIVGLGTLAAGVIGVSNIMLVIVRERTREIGIRRALGATPAVIVAQILFEATLLTTAAGYLGLMAGMGALEATRSLLAGADTTMFADPDVPVASALQALAVVVASGLFAGLMPARRAIRVTPVEALRSA